MAQLDSASDSDSEGRRFESFRVGQPRRAPSGGALLCFLQGRLSRPRRLAAVFVLWYDVLVLRRPMDTLYIVIPAYNEEASIARVRPAPSPPGRGFCSLSHRTPVAPSPRSHPSRTRPVPCPPHGSVFISVATPIEKNHFLTKNLRLPLDKRSKAWYTPVVMNKSPVPAPARPAPAPLPRFFPFRDVCFLCFPPAGGAARR